ncbi:MAG: hypothetical protein H0X16_00790 [Chloroflexi bacterium]|nr:hypothetical protein [Chloroflexota bacterium]
MKEASVDHAAAGARVNGRPRLFGGRRAQLGVILTALLVLAGVIVLFSLTTDQRGQGFGLSGEGDAAAYASLGTQGPTFDSATSLVQALADRGVTCEGLESRPAGSGELDAGRCKIGADDVVIRVFQDPGARNRYLASIGALLGEAGVESVPRVAGPNWLVSADTDATAQLVQDSIAGELLR